MNKNEQFVISINRELGSGGRTVGRKLAEKLGVEFFDKAIIKGLEERYNLSLEEIEKLRGRKHNWWEDFKRIVRIGEGYMTVNDPQSGQGAPDRQPDQPTTSEMFKAETEILQAIAEDESCVVAGRSGFFVFRNHPNHLSVFIQASMPFRVNRLVQKRGMTEEEALKIIKEVDEMRENYVKKYTGTTRYDTRNYDIVITADGKTEDEIVEHILSFIG